MSKKKRKIDWSKAEEYARRQLERNAAEIEDTKRGTKSGKRSDWSRKKKKEFDR